MQISPKQNVLSPPKIFACPPKIFATSYLVVFVVKSVVILVWEKLLYTILTEIQCILHWNQHLKKKENRKKELKKLI